MKKLIKNKSSNWLPDYTAKQVTSIDFEHLRKQGIKSCFFDLDHTLLVLNTKTLSPRSIAYLKDSGMDLYIATNRQYSPELDEIAKQIDAKGVMHAQSRTVIKPRKKYYRRAMEMTELKPGQIAMIGDRLVQDAWGAKRLGINTVLVNKLGRLKWHDHFFSLQDRLLPIVFARCYKD